MCCSSSPPPGPRRAGLTTQQQTASGEIGPADASELPTQRRNSQHGRGRVQIGGPRTQVRGSRRNHSLQRSPRTSSQAPARGSAAAAGVFRTNRLIRPADAFLCRTSQRAAGTDRKSTRLNSSHIQISYAVFCLKKNLCTGDPDDGEFTYEDPILAMASLWSRTAATEVGIAAAPGEDLKNSSWLSWALVGVHAWLKRGDRSYALLGGRTPTTDLVLNKEKVRLAIVGDAGYAGRAQDTVLRLIWTRHRAE